MSFCGPIIKEQCIPKKLLVTDIEMFVKPHSTDDLH